MKCPNCGVTLWIEQETKLVIPSELHLSHVPRRRRRARTRNVRKALGGPEAGK